MNTDEHGFFRFFGLFIFCILSVFIGVHLWLIYRGDVDDLGALAGVDGECVVGCRLGRGDCGGSCGSDAHAVGAVEAAEVGAAFGIGGELGGGGPFVHEGFEALAFFVDGPVLIDEGGIGAAPGIAGPEDPHHNAVDGGVAVGGAVDEFELVGADFVVGIGGVEFADPDRQAQRRHFVEALADDIGVVEDILVEKVALNADAIDHGALAQEVADLCDVLVGLDIFPMLIDGENVVIVDEEGRFGVDLVGLLGHPGADILAEAVDEKCAVEHFVIHVPALEAAFEVGGGAGEASFDGVAEVGRRRDALPSHAGGPLSASQKRQWPRTGMLLASHQSRRASAWRYDSWPWMRSLEYHLDSFSRTA